MARVVSPRLACPPLPRCTPPHHLSLCISAWPVSCLCWVLSCCCCSVRGSGWSYSRTSIHRVLASTLCWFGRPFSCCCRCVRCLVVLSYRVSCCCGRRCAPGVRPLTESKESDPRPLTRRRVSPREHASTRSQDAPCCHTSEGKDTQNTSGQGTPSCRLVQGGVGRVWTGRWYLEDGGGAHRRRAGVDDSRLRDAAAPAER